MQFKRRGNTVQLYRSHWVPKNAAGNARGYPDPKYVGCLADDAEELPAELFTKLSDSERAEVETKILVPARLAAAERRRLEELRDRDPRWRIEEALRLLREASELSTTSPVPGGLVSSIAATVSTVQTLEALTPLSNVGDDPLKAAVAAVKEAARRTGQGRYPRPLPGKARDSRVYKSWRELGEAVNDLQAALQEYGWVKRKGGS